MEPTLFSFIWKYSKRQQLVLLLMTLITFPFIYASLELPKMIINDAIGSTLPTVGLWGYEISQVQYLLVLCLAFLGTVLAAGLLKMRVNTMKGVLSERLLRRLRYLLISRMMRFPRPYFQNTSQGELVSMITSEAEPMGGLMGDAVAQPAFQFGQMMTIVFFLFMQSFWFGLASIALIPLQAWLIPKLQRQINLLNKDRIQEIRHLSSEIGESAAGISDLRANGGWRYRLAMLTDRLGRLFEIRFQIYQKKFFMKFLNNTITQMTPFAFYLVGGYLAIRGDITVGALVAAIAAYKDLSSPWKELLTYYNQVQDMSLRWEVVTERFAPRGMIDEGLFEGEPAEIPHLKGEIELKNVTVRDAEGNTVLEDIDLTIPPGARVAIQCSSTVERAAFAHLLIREVLPVRGHVTLAGQDLAEMHQAVIAARIGYAHSRPYLFGGTLGDNLLMPLKIKPQPVSCDPKERNRAAREARKSGNSLDVLDADWVDPGLAGLKDGEDIRDWWFQLVGAMGIDEAMFRRTLRSRFDPLQHPRLAGEIVDLREEVHEKLKEKGLDECVHRFEPDRFNPSIPLGGNLLFAAPARRISQEVLAGNRAFIRMLHEQGLAKEGLTISQAVMDILDQTFGRDGIDHPLFRRLGMEDEMYLRLSDIARKRRDRGDEALNEEELALLLTVPFLLTAEQIGPSFPDRFKEEIVALRKTKAEELRSHVGDMFVAVTPDVYVPRLTVLENALYGRVAMMAGARAEEIENVVAEIFAGHGLRQKVTAIMYDLPTGLGGANLPTVFQERAAFSRASIKRPDILILDKILASHDSESRHKTRMSLRNLLPDTTMIFMEDRFSHPDSYDMFVEIKGGRIDGVARSVADDPDGAGTKDLRRKQKAIASADLFAGLDARNQRLLAFGAQWFESRPGQVIFAHGQPPDAAYLCLEGTAELRWPGRPRDEPPISIVEPGRLIGDLSIITHQTRQLDLVSVGKSRFLRIGADEFRDVIESDASVALRLLEAVAGNLVKVSEVLSNAKIDYRDLVSGGDIPEALDQVMDELDG
ncbi:ABC transporter transmembrane domain-containing protein [Sedimentitalea sp. JM2-8]|uniref:ABC transporter transmembrane domain-containing protein n=1 Tax=Sedimentitalea xiamensis TaxID=3050037 RepID=A0ABT7F8Q7_9RHOB|nr:ABC transporter transmembrane domain-containing protein [Sedimentitalea xiamensis]MDK3071497.1 ABC transporter transmembrane domain-containing protein [Sedimentitalea xiamensis]